MCTRENMLDAEEIKEIRPESAKNFNSQSANETLGETVIHVVFCSIVRVLKWEQVA